MTVAPVLQAFAQQCGYARLRFYLRLHQDGRLPAFKGSLWHGWMGHMLKSHIALYHLCYGEHAYAQQPKPYVIHTDGNQQENWKKDDIVYFDLILLGDGCQAAEHLVSHMMAVTSLPLGPDRLPVSLHSIASVTPNGLETGVKTTCLSDWLTIKPAALSCEMAIQLATPLRLKQQGEIIKSGVPSLPFLLGQIARRLALLAEFWIDANQPWKGELEAALPLLGDYQQLGAFTRYEDWQRYSVRQKEQLPFGGLLGQLCYQGEVVGAIPWLQIGELIHLGGKTTFGLGQIQLIA